MSGKHEYIVLPCGAKTRRIIYQHIKLVGKKKSHHFSIKPTVKMFSVRCTRFTFLSWNDPYLAEFQIPNVN
jgi:hypothetical protein